MKHRLPLFALALFAMAALSGCNTFHGLGEDVSAVGNSIAHAAR